MDFVHLCCFNSFGMRISTLALAWVNPTCMHGACTVFMCMAHAHTKRELLSLYRLSKVLDGFTVADTLVIKAQVQVIL